MISQKASSPRFVACVLAWILSVGAAAAVAADQPQWGRRYTRNMVSDEKNLPATFDPATGKNIKWSAPLGSRAYGQVVVGGGRILVGTNNSRPRDRRHQGDRGVLMCLNEADGKLLWQLVVPKLRVPMADFGGVGLASPATIEGDRAYVVSNRGEVLCLDMAGQHDGNAGPFKDEGRYMTPKGEKLVKVAKTDADIIWRYDMVAGVGTRLHDAAHCSILVHGRFLYAGTCNGVDETHFKLPKPEAPGLIVLDKATGKLVAIDDTGMGRQLIHATWSSASVGKVGGRELIFLGGGDGVCYAFEPLKAAGADGKCAKLKTVWRFHSDPAGRKDVPLDFQDNRQDSPSTIYGMPVFHAGKVYFTAAGDAWHGKRLAWLKCVDASGAGDVTKTAQVWSSALQRHSMSTPAIHDGLIYIADFGRHVHCLDLKTGRRVWAHLTKGEIWASPLVADGKVYIGTMRSRLWVLAAGKTKKLLADVYMGSPMPTSPTAANGVLYIATMRTLYAIQKDAE